MKKTLLFLILSIGYFIANAQYFCDGISDHNNREINSNCSRVSPISMYDTSLLLSSYIPNESTPIVTIPVNINIWREDDGTGNWWQNTPAFRDSLQLAFNYLNIIFSQNVPYSLYIPNAQFIEDTKVRFIIDTVYYYNNSLLAHEHMLPPFENYLVSSHPERLKNFNIHLSIDTSSTMSGSASWYDDDYHSIVTINQYRPQHLYAFAQHMAHEFGHTFGLYHTYYKGSIETNIIDSSEFLWDVFGIETQTWCSFPPTKVCYHEAGWDCDISDPTNTCTNNIMGGTKYARHFSALQCGRIQRALQVSSMRHFAYGEVNPPDLHITSNQLVDYTRRYYQNVVVDSGGTLTVTCQVEMSQNARLSIRPGGKLVVDGGTLTSACSGEMWQGIEIVGDRNKRQLPQWQGSVELKNGAVIENAVCGIRTGRRFWMWR